MNREALVKAIRARNVPGIDELLAAGADINEADAAGRTPLMYAIIPLVGDPDPAIVRHLIARGANVNVHDRAQRWTCLHFAAQDQRAEIIRILLDVGASVEAVDAFGNTPLWRCVFTTAGNADAVAILLERGSDPGGKNARGVSPLDLARTRGRADLVALLSDARARSGEEQDVGGGVGSPGG